MCGFIFQKNRHESIDKEKFNFSLNKMAWRGIDAQNTTFLGNDTVALGHCRLAILDLNNRSDQPMLSKCGRYYILLNGEIYNHLEIRQKYNLVCETLSDTETVLEGYIKCGNDIFSILDGMFSIVIYDVYTSKWVAARDAFGIKPLYIYKSIDTVIVSSEAAVIASMTNSQPSTESLSEWEIIRQPLPGFSFFSGVDEILPGTIIDSNGYSYRHWEWIAGNESFKQDVFEHLLLESIKKHELSDVQNVSLLSGGLDSALIAACSQVNKSYTVGLSHNNEFDGAQDTSNFLHKELVKVSLEEDLLYENWRHLVKLKGEPLSLPNEGLIYQACKAMLPEEKVVLTGEGADELLFGYDRIFRWAETQISVQPVQFLEYYGYSINCTKSERLLDHLANLSNGKNTINFLEDFFYQVHLPGLLRRMDFSSMAASKEARVPFVSKDLIAYMYRKPSEIKISSIESKIPIRRFAEKLGLFGALERKKIGFSAQVSTDKSVYSAYESFREIILGELGWL